jgi:tetratricopeptide (TPR) repeat protein
MKIAAKTPRASAASLSGRALQACEQARFLQDAGDFEGARAALADVWAGVGYEPALSGLDDLAGGEVLLRAGSVSGWIGDSRPIEGAQEFAKNLVTRALEIFERLGDFERALEAKVELGICYWHQGALDEARVVFNQAYGAAQGTGGEQEARAILHAGIMDLLSDRLDDALETIQLAEPLYGPDARPAARGRFHSTRAMVLRRLYGSTKEPEYADRAFIEYMAAVVNFEEAGHERFVARTENNIVYLLMDLGRYDEAPAHLERARRIFLSLRDSTSVAQVNETAARVSLAQGRESDAERAAFQAVHVLERGDDLSLLAEALRTHGVALTRLGQVDSALAQFARSCEVAERAGDREGSGLTCLAMMEELQGRLRAPELAGLYLRAEDQLSGTQSPGLSARLAAGGRGILAMIAAGDASRAGGVEALLTGGTFDDEVRHFEGELIRRALRDSGGSVTAASRILGMSHQRLVEMLKNRHQDLTYERKPAQRRLRSIITKPQPPKSRGITVKS